MKWKIKCINSELIINTILIQPESCKNKVFITIISKNSFLHQKLNPARYLTN